MDKIITSIPIAFFLVAAVSAASHTIIVSPPLLTASEIAANAGLNLPPRPSGDVGGWTPGPAWSSPVTTPPPTTGWSNPTVGWSPETTTVGWGALETTTEGWGAPETTTVGWGPQETTTEGWGAPETTTVGWAPQETTTEGWGAPETTTVGWAPQETTTEGWGAPETTTTLGWPGKFNGWAPTTAAPKETTTVGWTQTTAPGWSPTSAPSGWSAPSSEVDIAMDGQAAVTGWGAAGAEHSSITTITGDSDNLALLDVITGSWASLIQNAGVTQLSSADSDTGESSTVQLVEGSNLVDAGDFFEGQMSGNEITVQNQGSSFAVGQGAVGLAGCTENNISAVP